MIIPHLTHMVRSSQTMRRRGIFECVAFDSNSVSRSNEHGANYRFWVNCEFVSNSTAWRFRAFVTVNENPQSFPSERAITHAGTSMTDGPSHRQR